MLDGFILLRRVPPASLPNRPQLIDVLVLGPDGVRPREVVVHLDEVVVAQHRLAGLHAAEEVHHALLELGLEAGDVARGVDFGEGHPELVLEAPEAREQDGAREQVVLPVGLLKHDGQVVLHEARGGLHRVLGERALCDVEGFAREEVVDAGGGAGVEGRVALGEVVGELLEELDRAVKGFGGGAAALAASFGDAAGLVGVEAEELLVKLDPLVPLHSAKAHGDVIGTVTKGAVRNGLCGVDIPVGVRRCRRTFKFHGGPYPRGPLRGFGRATAS